MPSPKKPFKNDKTIVDAEFLTSIFGGDDGYASVTPPSPFFKGHLHDGDDNGAQWGHAPKIDLAAHTVGRVVLAQPELKSIKLSAMQAAPLTSSLFWTMPVPSDAYRSTEPSAPVAQQNAAPQSFYLKLYWSANGAPSAFPGTGTVAFRLDWIYLQPGKNVLPPSIIFRGPSAWPVPTAQAASFALNNPTPTTFRFQVSSVSASQLYVNNNFTGSSIIQLTLPIDAPGIQIDGFKLFGLEVSSAPTVTLTSPMTQVNIYAAEILYYSQVLGNNNGGQIIQPSQLLPNDPGLADF